MSGAGNFILKQGSQIYDFLGQHMKYHLKEKDSFKELH